MRALLHSFDKKHTKAIQSWPESLRGIMLFATLIGQPVFTLGIAALVAGIGFGSGDARLLFAGMLAGFTLGIGTVLKITLRRSRPLTDYVMNMRFNTFSLPSGHSVGAVVSYGLLGMIALTALPLAVGVPIAALLAIAIVMIGISRVYLGAHYPSDVLAGWALGALGLSGIIAILG